MVGVGKLWANNRTLRLGILLFRLPTLPKLQDFFRFPIRRLFHLWKRSAVRFENLERPPLHADDSLRYEPVLRSVPRVSCAVISEQVEFGHEIRSEQHAAFLQLGRCRGSRYSKATLFNPAQLSAEALNAAQKSREPMAPLRTTSSL